MPTLCRLEKNVRLDLALNFDQVWKAAWTNPVKVLTRVLDTQCPSVTLKGKREQLWAELHRLQHQGNTEWEAKRRRIAGPLCSSMPS